ncbi:MAG: hypothetical protein AABZ15_16685 [Nitrospirota bacterium]
MQRYGKDKETTTVILDSISCSFRKDRLFTEDFKHLHEPGFSLVQLGQVRKIEGPIGRFAKTVKSLSRFFEIGDRLAVSVDVGLGYEPLGNFLPDGNRPVGIFQYPLGSGPAV